ncbi:MAG: tRNA (adenosine(37)-N6)-threonylcarbamoyltransferase complex dimerization subunit type 1 TsaB [Planctomycetota bacterium]|nr:tRNA (adenosine(37)-N6)-threonylcarbamoyltransferase complex dimerization subunit type 1 TsaB [Planctomycetota bacterium]
MSKSTSPCAASDWLLAIAASGQRGSVALFCGDELREELALAEDLRHAQLLLPAIADCLTRAGLAAKDLSAIAVDIGPGSYTGSRIGVMAARCLAYASASRLIAVSSLAALAWEARPKAPTILAVQDARRGEVYAAVYEVASEMPQPIVADCALTPEEATALPLPPGSAVVGGALAKYSSIFQRCAAAGFRLLPDNTSPRARVVGDLARRKLRIGDLADPLRLQPVYPRRDNAPSEQ